VLYLGLRNNQTSKAFVNNLFLGFNISAMLILIVKGLPLFIDGLRPSWIVFTVALLFCILGLFANVEITGNLFLDSFLVGFAIVSIASIIPAGVWQLYKEGLTMNLFWSWLIISLIIGIIAKTIYWLSERG